MKNCWVLVDAEKAGARNQCLGLAEALSLEPKIIPLHIKKPWVFLPESIWPKSLNILAPETKALLDHELQVAPPLLIIASGRKSVLPAYMVKKKVGCPVVLLQKPKIFKSSFDLIVTPEHDRFFSRKGLVILGNTHRVTREKCQREAEQFAELGQLAKGHHVVCLLVGGPNRAFHMSSESLILSLESLVRNLEQDKNLFIVASLSRRTPEPIAKVLQSITHPRFYLWNGESPNPYFAFLHLAHTFVITADSVAMVSEAAATGKGIHLIMLPGKSKKFTRFYEVLSQKGITRSYEGELKEWSYPPLQETQRVADFVRAHLLKDL